MKQLIQKIALLALFSSSLFVSSSTKKVSAIAPLKPAKLIARASVPISWIAFNTGFERNMMMAQFVVPDRNTTIAAGGGLRRYDAHMAKMFELTHYECLDRAADRDWNGIRWQYYAGNQDIDMGTFNIGCSLARDIATAYGLGRPEMTSVTYYRADTNIYVPKLNIVGGKVATWRRFTRNFKPVAQVPTTDDFIAFKSASEPDI